MKSDREGPRGRKLGKLKRGDMAWLRHGPAKGDMAQWAWWRFQGGLKKTEYNKTKMVVGMSTCTKANAQ